MTQQVVHVRVSLPDGTTFEDTASFSFTAEATGSSPTLDPGNVQNAIHAFLTTAYAGTSVSNFLSPALSRTANAVTCTYTDVTAHLDGSNAGAPIATLTDTLLASGTTVAMPAQLAVCMGYRANYGSDIERGPVAVLPSDDHAIDEGAPATHSGTTRPRARDRARFYLGPLGDNCIKSSVTGNPADQGLVSVAAAATFAGALDAFLKTQLPGDAFQWNVVCWSRRNAAVKTPAFYFLDEGLCTVRKREDTTLNRVHAWNAI